VADSSPTLGDRVFLPALAGTKAQVLGNPDMPHTYAHIPDIGSALFVLGERSAALGQAWHLPNSPPKTTRELVDIVYRAAGRFPRLRAAPNLMVRAAGLVNPTMRELIPATTRCRGNSSRAAACAPRVDS
jgi:nucleoside-diphosphate-sugar epimerase